MKNSKKVFNNAGQSTIEVKKSQKHDANLQKNSTLYFQIGLILCLLGTYALFEMQFQDKKYTPDSLSIDEVAVVDVAPVYQVEIVQQKKPEPKVDRSSRLIDKYEEVEDTTTKIETKIFTPDAPEPSSDPVNVGDIVIDEIPDELPPIDIGRVEIVPIYPGCEKHTTNDKRKKCMSKKITKLVGKKFNTNIANQYGISGLQKIQTQFTVDKNGNVTDIKIRGPHPALEKEAKRVIDKIPHMKPGIQRDKPVGVIYTLPIKFEVRN
ncbi:energy transducer TonB [Winogradskyella flava]|uniref:energy transducer TonB n=1 Tax=Winogradskyella flava TaxID=1884876 RepID=UPI0024938580|nr:energy transducer TonB [Winogradskyella flava]